jgi:hypothetical protein
VGKKKAQVTEALTVVLKSLEFIRQTTEDDEGEDEGI